MSNLAPKGLEHLTPDALELRKRQLVNELVRQQQLRRGVPIPPAPYVPNPNSRPY